MLEDQHIFIIMDTQQVLLTLKLEQMDVNLAQNNSVQILLQWQAEQILLIQQLCHHLINVILVLLQNGQLCHMTELLVHLEVLMILVIILHLELLVLVILSQQTKVLEFMFMVCTLQQHIVLLLIWMVEHLQNWNLNREFHPLRSIVLVMIHNRVKGVTHFQV